MDRDLINYCNVLQMFGWKSREVRQFKEKFKDDIPFLRRAFVLEKLFGRKQPSIVDFVNLYHANKKDCNAEPIINYLADYRFDEVFQRRARAFLRLCRKQHLTA